LNCIINSPNGNKLPLRLLSQESLYTLTFTPVYEGDYKIQISWNGYPLPNTPLIAKCDQASDITKIQIKGAGLKEVKINEEADFIIDGSKAGNLFGFPEIKVAGTKTDIDVRIQQIAHNIFRCTYTPYIPGTQFY
jgi:filamin